MKKIIFLLTLFLSSFELMYSQAPVPPNDLNWVSSIRYDLLGTTIGKSVNYFNSLGKSTQSQSWDITTQKIWNSETRYDYHGRPALQTLSAPIGDSFSYQSNFIKKSNGGTYTIADYEADPLNPTTVGNASNSLGRYYSTLNTDAFHEGNKYQDITSYPFSRTVYSKLNPGKIKAVVGGNKTDTNNDGVIDHRDKWLQTYSFTMPAPGQATGVSKTVSRDVHGVEVVVFTDAEGNTIKAARSGDEDGIKPKRTVYSSIKELGYVDVHIPTGCSGITVYDPRSLQYTVYNLITESIVSNYSLSRLSPGFYRIAVRNINNYTYNRYAEIRVRHQINYYDFTTNTYDKVGRLLRSTQPNSSALVSQFKYNSLGQLLETTSPDEGKAQFKYRKDGQIRFSQNSKQKEAAEFSYTNYDPLGRPIESGVLTADFSEANPETDAMPTGTKKEQQFTLYDTPDITGLEALKSSGQLSRRYRSQKYVAGNVSKTWTQNPDTNTTWYSYDAYGRVTWIIQDIEGLGLKTIHYGYDFAQGQVTTVEYQKHKADERFIHRYSYNDAGQLTQVETSIDNQSFVVQATYEYYETGALKRTELAEGIQGTDYVYNLNGQLKSINHPALSAAKDPGEDANDLFGMQIDYHAFDYARTQNTNITTASIGTDQFNGNIKNTRWNTSGSLPTPREHVYSYDYNKNNWLTDANFSATENDANGIQADIQSTAIVNLGQTLPLEASNSIRLLPGFHAKTGSVFSAKIVEAPIVIPEGDYDVNNITYDANGNIQTLNRNGYTGNGTNAMDNFTYNYKAGTNQLATITDANDNPDANRYNDLKSQGNSASTNYIYNSIGQLKTNLQDQIGYEYNAAGLVTKINSFYRSKTSSWSSIYNNGFNTLADTQTVSQWIFRKDNPFEETSSELAFIYGGSILETDDELILQESSGNPNEILQDHDRITETVIGIGDKTPKGPISGCLNLTQTYGASVELTMDNATAIRNLSVVPHIYHKLDLDVIVKHSMKGDTDQIKHPAGAIITIKDANGLVLGTVAYNSPNPVLSQVIGETNSACAPFFTEHANFEFIPTTSTISIEVQRDSASGGRVHIDNIHLQVATKVQLTFFYDDRGQRVRKEASFYSDIIITYYVRDAAGSVMAIYKKGGRGYPLALKENPIYGSSRLGVHYRQSNTDAYQLTDHLGNVRAVIMKNGENAVSLTAKTDYYPFGMPMPNRNLEGNYRYKYQGQEKDPETGKEAFELRLWDSRIGRWLTPDPYGEFSSPYVGMGNNPITTIDIDGGKIYVTNKAGISYEYKNGSLYDKNGNIYSGDDKFLNATRAALGKLDYATSSYAINDGKIEKTGTIHRLVKSDDIYAIVYKRGAHKTGGRIYIDNKATVSTPTAAGIKKSPYEITLAHELGHLYSKNNGFYNGNEWFNIEGQSRTFDENFASHWENIFRSALDLPLRTHYGVFDGKPYEPSKLFWPRGAFFHKPVSTIAPKPIITLEVGPLIQGEIEH